MKTFTLSAVALLVSIGSCIQAERVHSRIDSDREALMRIQQSDLDACYAQVRQAQRQCSSGGAP